MIQLGLSNFDTAMDRVKILFHESVLHRKVLPGNLNTSVFWEMCLSSFSPYRPVMRGSGAVWGKWRRRRERRLRSVVVDTKSPWSRVARTKRSHWTASKRCAVAVAACEPFCVPQSLIFFKFWNINFTFWSERWKNLSWKLERTIIRFTFTFSTLLSITLPQVVRILQRNWSQKNSDQEKTWNEKNTENQSHPQFQFRSSFHRCALASVLQCSKTDHFHRRPRDI